MSKYQGEPLNILHTIGMDKLYPIIRVHLTVDQGFDPAKFKQALGQCAKVVPELFCKYVLNDNSFVTVTNDPDKVVFENCNPDEDSANWDLFKDPQIRVYLNQTSQGYDVCILLSHILTDGAGTKQLLYLLAQAYNGESLSGMTNHQDIDWLRQLIADHPVTVKAGTDHPAKPLSLPALSQWGGQKRLTETLTLSTKLTASLIQASHHGQVTLNDLFMASFGQAVQRFSTTDRIALACPTDMRQFIPGPRQLRVANHTSRYNINVFSDPDRPFTKVVHDVHQAMADDKASFQCLASVQTLVENYDRYSLKKLQQICEDNYHVRTISYTNFGIIDNHRFHFDGTSIKSFDMLGSYRRAPMFQVAVSTFHRQITFAFAMIGTANESRFGRAIMEIMRDLLTNYSLEIALN